MRHDPNLVSHLHVATTFLNPHFQILLLSIFPLSFSFLLMVQAKRAIFQQNHPLTIKLKSSNFVNTKLLIHETNKTIKEVKRKRLKKLLKKKKTLTKTHQDLGVNHGKIIFILVRALFFYAQQHLLLFLLRAFLFIYF